jgi:Zn-dependent peptidase ImmA (M78 family)
MRRGFKAEAERLTDRLRIQLGLSPDKPVDPLRLAAHMRVEVVSAADLVGIESLRELEQAQPGAFSAAAFHLPQGRTVAVFNPCSEPARTKSDIAHELAHILLDHQVRELQQISGHPFFTCDPEQEEEANWLAGSLLLPRALLLQYAYAGADAALIAAECGVSVPMARFRLNTSGVLLQAKRTRTARRTST